MSKKLTYTNQKGDLFYFREVSGKRGVRIVCSQKGSADDLSAIPETHEIAENPNGQVSCRKKRKSNITQDEVEYAESILPSMMEPNIHLFVEKKKNALIVYMKDVSRTKKLAGCLPGNARQNLMLMANQLTFEPVLKFELIDKDSRRFAGFRMCYIGSGEEWMFLKEGRVCDLVEDLGPHIGQESFYELF